MVSDAADEYLAGNVQAWAAARRGDLPRHKVRHSARQSDADHHGGRGVGPAVLGVWPKKPAAKGEPSAGQYFCSKDDRWLVFTHVAGDANRSKLLQALLAPGRDAACMPPRQGAAITTRPRFGHVLEASCSMDVMFGSAPLVQDNRSGRADRQLRLIIPLTSFARAEYKYGIQTWNIVV